MNVSKYHVLDAVADAAEYQHRAVESVLRLCRNAALCRSESGQDDICTLSLDDNATPHAADSIRSDRRFYFRQSEAKSTRPLYCGRNVWQPTRFEKSWGVPAM